MESLIDYKKILIYIKENGIYDIEKILNDYDNLCSEKKENIILEDLLGSDLLQKLRGWPVLWRHHIPCQCEGRHKGRSDLSGYSSTF